MLREALTSFFDVRETPGLRKKPSTSELLDWIKLLLAEDIAPEALRGDDPKKVIPVLHGALLKNEQDVHLFEQLVFLNRRAGGEAAPRCWSASSPICSAGGVPVTLPEFLSLLEALEARVASLSAEEFYYLARMAMVKDERHFDRFDRVFAQHFEGAEKLFEKIVDGVAARVAAAAHRAAAE